MRVRSLQSYLKEYNLLKKSSLDNVRNLRLGIDALYFFRTTDLKDTLCDGSGYISPCIFHLIDKQCEYFKKLNISLIFIFDGITPKAHKLFSAQYHQNMNQGWFYYVNDEKKLCYKNFSQISNICNSDLLYLLFHYLKGKGYKCMIAPYLAIAQLSYFLEINMIDVILGSPTILLHNSQKIILNFVWKKNFFEWVDLHHLLKTWNINKEQFIDACLLAGTEYCLTFPYLNLSHFNHGNSQFNFGTSIEFIKQSPLISYLQHFFNDELRNNYIEGYCICKTLIKFPVVLLCNGKVNCFIPDKNWLNMKLKDNALVINGVKKDNQNKTIDDDDNNNKKEINEKVKKISNVSTTNLNIDTSSKSGVHSSDVLSNNNKNIFPLGDNSEKQNNSKNANYENSNIFQNVNNTKKKHPNIKGSTNANTCDNDNPSVNKKGDTCFSSVDKNQNSTNTNHLNNPNINEYNLNKSDNKSVGTNPTDQNGFVRNKNKNGSNEKENNRDSHLNNKNENISVNNSKDNINDDTSCDKNDIHFNLSNDHNLFPYDYIKVIGARFPVCVYYLMSIGFLSKKILSVLALGEWADYSHPIIDSYEYRDSLVDLREYRCRILGLISIKLTPFFYKRKIKFFDYGHYINNIWDKNNKYTLLDIDLADGFLWNINKDNVAEEIKRQNNNKIDLQFTLRWHLYSESKCISLIHKNKESDFDEDDLSDQNEKLPDKNLRETSDSNTSKSGDANNSSNSNDNNKNYLDKKIKNYNEYYKNILCIHNQSFNSILCLTYFMFLENLSIFTKNCDVTLFGLLLSESKNKNIDGNILIIFELLKFGFLTTQPMLPSNGKYYPKNAYSSVMNNKNLDEQDKKSVLLLSRIYSLYNANLDQQKTYDGFIDFDLCAFFSLVKVIKRSLKQLLQACVSNILISNMDLMHILPENLFIPLDTYISGFFVTHNLMGVLTKFFLLFNFDDLKKKKISATLNSDKAPNLNEVNSNEDANCNKKDTLENKKNNTDLSNVDEKYHELNYEVNKTEGKNILHHNYNSNDLHNNKMNEDKINHENFNENHNNVNENGATTNINEKESTNKIKNMNGNLRSNNNKDYIKGDTVIIDEANKNDIKNSQFCNSSDNKNSEGDASSNFNNQENSYRGSNNKYDENINSCDYNEYKYCEQNTNNCDGNSKDVLIDNFNEFEKVLRKKFPSFSDPINDLCHAINMWRDHLSLIVQIEKHTNVYDLVSDLRAADRFLEKKIHYIGLHKVEAYINICSSYNEQ